MEQLKKAIKNLGMIRLLKLESREIRLAILLNKEEWKHLSSSWWKGKSASIVGVDLEGNFILCKSSGEFVLWVHQLSSEVHISHNLTEFLSKLELDETNVP